MKHEQKNTVVGRITVGALFIIFTVVLMVIFYNAPGQVGDTTPTAAEPEKIFSAQSGQNVRLDDLTQNPDDFLGQLVSVRGEVRQNIGLRGMTIDRDDGDLLVISRTALVGVGGGPGTLIYNENDDIAVSGVVKEFNISEIEEELGVDLDDEMYREYEGMPVVIADSISEVSEL